MDRAYQPTPSVLQPAHGGGRSTAFIARVDPRLRILAAIAVAIMVAAAHQFATPLVALLAVLLALALSGLSARAVFQRLLPLNLLMLVLLAILPLSTPGTPLLEVGPRAFSREGLLLAAVIALKGNVIVLALLVLLGTLDATTLGHALSHLRVPDKLTHLLLFTVRYIDVLHRESLRLRAAMKVRGFRPRMNLHTYRSYGYLLGMLLVRSFDRSERIMAAMKCRGFQGRFYMLDHFHFSRCDPPFAAAALLTLAVMVAVEWL